MRSVAFALAAVCTAALLAGPYAVRVPSPGRSVTWSLAFWCAWSFASVTWSIDPSYTAAELRAEIVWGVLTMTVFYVIASIDRAWRPLLATVLVTAAVMGVLACAVYVSSSGGDPAPILLPLHIGVSAYSTFIVITLPFILLMLARPPVGFGERRWSTIAAAALIGIALCAARVTDNRIIWIAVAAMVIVCVSLAAWRWPGRWPAKPERWVVIVAMSVVLVGWQFVGAVEERVRIFYPAETSAWQNLAGDPRLGLWRYLAERITERPLAGYGFGKAILGEQLRTTLQDPLLSHAHNTFASQWLQTGAIGLAAFVLLLVVLVRRYVQYLRSADVGHALLGLAGLALITVFCVKGLTDDILNRSSGKEFWALNAMLLGFGVRLSRRHA